MIQLASVVQQRDEFSILKDELSSLNIDLEEKCDALIAEVKSLKNEKSALLLEKTWLKESLIALQASTKKIVALNQSVRVAFRMLISQQLTS